MLFIGDDWAEGHHDMVAQDDAGKALARRRLPEGADGLARFHELVASCLGEDAEPDPARVIVVIETDRGPWVKALAGYRVYPANPEQAARHKEVVANSGKKDDFFDAGCLADMGRTAPHLAQPDVIAEACAASVQAAAAVITALNEQVKVMEAKVSGFFRRHPDAGLSLSQPGIGDITAARILGGSGDAPGRYATARARKNYAGTSR